MKNRLFPGSHVSLEHPPAHGVHRASDQTWGDRVVGNRDSSGGKLADFGRARSPIRREGHHVMTEDLEALCGLTPEFLRTAPWA